MKRFLKLSALLVALVCAGAMLTLSARAQAPHPSDVFGFMPGDDYKLATYDQMVAYYRALDEASSRVTLREIGTSVLGRPLLLLYISSRRNLRRLDQWREISEKLARADISPDEALELADTGKAIVWIDGGLHATEVAGAQMTPLLAYRVATEESPEMEHIRANTILLLMPVMNPDGLDIVANWYAHTVHGPYEATRPPWLYHYYVGHDNNRDWFMNNMPESRAVTDILYNEWYPQIVYNHHQTSPSHTRIFLPPFADPVNPRIHPGVTTSVNMVGTAMANRFAIKQMPGAVSGVIYSMWWNGGMRTVPYFHNMVGILTETGHATPSPRSYEPDSMPSTVAGGHSTAGTNIFYPFPWKGGTSRFSDPIRYMLTGSMAVLRLAADLRSQWLHNIYQMGRDAIEASADDVPKSYIIPAKQWNQGEELSLVNVLRIGGIAVERVAESFTHEDVTYAPGSFVIHASQAFRPYLLDLMEKQDYPSRRRTPYDLAGWTLPLQMGIEVVRVMTDSFDVRGATVVEALDPGPVSIKGSGGAFAYSHRPNWSIAATNRLLAAGEDVYMVTDSGGAHVPGTFVVSNSGATTRAALEAEGAASGTAFEVAGAVPGTARQLSASKIGLYKSWVANMDEGWTRWLLEEYAFDVDTLHDADIQAGRLSQFDVIILPHQSAGSILRGHSEGFMPPEYVGGLGLTGALALEQYVKAGGTLVALDGASDFVIDQFGLPVQNVVSNASQSTFFIPGSLVRITVDTTQALAYGMPAEAAAYFVRSRAFRTVQRTGKGEGGQMELTPAPALPVTVIARYANQDILLSGWARGAEQHIGGEAAIMQVGVGSGRVVLYGFRPQFRGQPRGTYKLFFNALLSPPDIQQP